MPTWALAGIFAAVLLAIGGGVYYYMGRGIAPAGTSAESTTAPAASRQKIANPLQKYVEVVGLRMMTEGKQPMAKFLVVNHGTAEISGLAANVKLWASTSRSEEDSVGSFSFRLPRIGANDSKELTEPLKTKLKIYELPDWQNATAEIEITEPAGQ